MSSKNPTTWKNTLLGVIISAIAGSLISFGFPYIENAIGINFPSGYQVTSQLASAIHIWTNIAVIESPKHYALNAMVLVTILSAIINSWNRDSPSPTLSSIFTVPGVAVWSRLFTKIIKFPIIGTFLYSLGVAARLYLWVISMIVFFFYAIKHINNSPSSLFVATSSVLLASATFGAVFGRFEKALVLSMRSTYESIPRNDKYAISKRWRIYWLLMLPTSFSFAFYITKVGVSSLEDPSLGIFLSSLSSIFLSTFLLGVIFFYLIGLAVLLILICYKFLILYKDGEWRLREKVWIRCKAYIKEEFNKGEPDDDMSGYPDEVVEALSADYNDETQR